MVPPCSDRISRVPPYSRTSRDLRIRGYHPLRPDFPDRSASSRKATGLLRFRSPLLAESLLMSVPPGTEMFQFPGFASHAYVFSMGYPSRGGLPHSDIHGSTPARGSPWLFAACHVLHRLLVPRHPPNALLMLDTPGSPSPGRQSHPPCTGTIHARYAGVNTTRPTASPLQHTLLTPLNAAARQPLSAQPVPIRDRPGHSARPDRASTRRTTPAAAPTRRSRARPGRPPRCPTRPGTHQNQIHMTKEPAPRTSRGRPQQASAPPQRGSRPA